MNWRRAATDGGYTASYKDAYTFVYVADCIISIFFGILAAVLHGFILRRRLVLNRQSEYLDKSIFARFRPIWVEYGLTFAYGFMVLWSSPQISLRFLSFRDWLPHLWMVMAVQLSSLAICATSPMASHTPKIFMIIASMSIAIAAGLSIQTVVIFDLVTPQYSVAVGFASSVPVVAGIVFVFSARFCPCKPINGLPVALKSKWMWFTISFAIAAFTMMSVIFAGLCIAPYAYALEGPRLGSLNGDIFNTRFLRTFTEPGCKDVHNGVCHVYLTAGPDLTSSVFVNVHLPKDRDVASLKITVDGTRELSGTEFRTPALDERDQRHVYSVFVGSLSSGQDHSFTLSSNNGPVGEPVYWFRLASTSSIKLAMGGDAGVSDIGTKVLDKIMTTSPDVLVVAGDSAYDNGFFTCACARDAWLSLIESRRVDGKYLVPLLLSIGNHDIGFYEDTEGGSDYLRPENCDESNVPVFFTWFPFSETNGQVNSVCNRYVNRVHTVPSLVNLWVLDTAYISKSEEVVAMVDATMPSVSAQPLNIATYHVPLYPSDMSPPYEGLEVLRDFWPKGIFDKYNFTVCYENHVHKFKRTKPLIGNAIAPPGGPKGTVYIGDGNMATADMGPESPSALETPTDDIFEKVGRFTHFHSVTITQGHIVNHAINVYGTVVDVWENL